MVVLGVFAGIGVGGEGPIQLVPFLTCMSTFETRFCFEGWGRNSKFKIIEAFKVGLKY